MKAIEVYKATTREILYVLLIIAALGVMVTVSLESCSATTSVRQSDPHATVQVVGQRQQHKQGSQYLSL